MRVIGSLITFCLLVLAMHWALFALNPGIAEVHTSAVHMSPRAQAGETASQ